MGKVQDDDRVLMIALIAGATGLIGGQLLDLLLDSNRYDSVVALTRKELPKHSKLIQVKMDQTMGNLGSTLGIDDVFCSLGTTMAKARSKEKFYEVDFTYPFLLAKNSLGMGAKQFLIVSALGANKNSSVYYSRVKGEIEEAVSGLGFISLHIFRPSLLLGPRQENRSAEEAAKFFYKVFGFIVPKKYKAIESVTVARAMLQFASREQTGIFIHESAELQDF